MQNIRTSQRIFPVYCLLIAVSSLIILISVFMSPSESGNRIWLGLSLPRLIFALGLFIILIFFISIFTKAANNPVWAEKTLDQWFGENPFSKRLFWLTSISFGVGWIGCFLPDYRLGTLVNYWIRIRPVLAFILFASVATLTVFFIRRSRMEIGDLRKSKTFSLGVVLFFVIMLIWITMYVSRFGFYSSDDYWNASGVPLLASQLIAGVLGGWVFAQLEGKWTFKPPDIFVFIFIYAVTAAMWAHAPLQGSFFFDVPRPPNQVLYPYVDSAIFDTASQFALIGEKIHIFNGYFFERPLYLSFLVYLHTFFGQDYKTLMAAQAAILAIFPALIYLIGRSLNMRAVGFASAIIACLRGLNAIAASSLIDLAGPKMMLTDFPTAIAVALVILLTCEWLKAPKRNWHFALWVGGAIACAIMLRTNGLLLLPLIPLYAIFMFYPEWKKWLFHTFLIGVAVIAITLPWELRNKSLGGEMYGSIVNKIKGTIDNRYTPKSDPNTSLPQKLLLTSFKSTQTLFVLSKQTNSPQDGQPCNTIVCFASSHFLHNIVTSVLILPASPSFDDLRHTVKINNAYWRQDWDGSLPAAAFFFVAVNLFLMALGISSVWRQHRWSGLAPLAIFIFYNVGNALARTSGGRYIVPADWILTIYYLLGIFQVITSLANAIGKRWILFSEVSDQNLHGEIFTRNKLPKLVMILVILLVLGGFIPLSEHLHVKRYQNYDMTKVLKENSQAILNTGLDVTAIESFLQVENAQILVGRALYPRYYKADQMEPHFYPITFTGFSRTVFNLIGPTGEEGVLLPGGIPKYFPHGSDVIAIGCKNGTTYMDALIVIVLGSDSQVYSSEPISEDLQCPLKQYTCENNFCQ